MEYLEERGIMVVRNDLKGMRIVNFKDIGWENEKGEKNENEDKEEMGKEEE